jgi:hypothetical protein
MGDRWAMPIDKFVGIGASRGEEVFYDVLGILETERPAIITLDENPIDFSTLIHMRTSPRLFNEEFVRAQIPFLLKRELAVSNCAGILYALRHESTPVYFVDGSFHEPLSDTGEETGIYPYFTSIEFASSVDLMKTPIRLWKQRVPTYPGWDFEYELIHSYQTDTKFEEMDRVIWQRNRFSALAIDQIMAKYGGGTLAFVGDRKRFRFDLYSATEGITKAELSEFVPLQELVSSKEKKFYDAAQ